MSNIDSEEFRLYHYSFLFSANVRVCFFACYVVIDLSDIDNSLFCYLITTRVTDSVMSLLSLMKRSGDDSHSSERRSRNHDTSRVRNEFCEGVVSRVNLFLVWRLNDRISILSA